MSGYIASAFVKLLELQEKSAIEHQNMVRARLTPIEYELMQAAAEVRAIRQVLAEARKLTAAITERREWYIQPDGSVKTDAGKNTFSAPVQEELR